MKNLCFRNMWNMFYRFVDQKVVRSLTILLRDFDTNTPQLNHYIIKLMHRIAFDCKMYAMLFQISIFRIFQRILSSKNREHKVIHTKYGDHFLALELKNNTFLRHFLSAPNVSQMQP